MRTIGFEGQGGQSDGKDLVWLCCFMAGGRRFGIDTRMIREVLGLRTSERVPLAPAYVAGLLLYRGEVLTAVSFRSLLGSAATDRASYVLVLDGEDERFGLMVDSVEGVEAFERSSLTANPTTLDRVSRALFSGAYRMHQGLLIHLDPARLGPMRLAQTGLFEPIDASKGQMS